MELLSPDESCQLSHRGWFVKQVGTADGADLVMKAAAREVSAREGLTAYDVRQTAAVEVPQAEHPPGTSFQCLHFDYGHPFDPRDPTDLHLVVGLFCQAERHVPTAATRLLHLAKLARARRWPNFEIARQRIAAYGKSHGSWVNWELRDGYVEKTVARIVDAIDATGELTPFRQLERETWFVRSHGGNEFESERDELTFFARHELEIENQYDLVRLHPGELLVLDNTAVCHGRRGQRQPRELLQSVYGHRNVSPASARQLGECVITRLIGHVPGNPC